MALMKTTSNALNGSTGYAAVGSDGMRLVVWGIGDTAKEARADAVDSVAQGMGGAAVALECYEITADQAAVVESGDVSWPVVVPS